MQGKSYYPMTKKEYLKKASTTKIIYYCNNHLLKIHKQRNHNLKEMPEMEKLSLFDKKNILYNTFS